MKTLMHLGLQVSKWSGPVSGGHFSAIPRITFFIHFQRHTDTMLVKSCHNVILDEAFLASYHMSEQRLLKRSHDFARNTTEVSNPSYFLCFILLFCHDGSTLNNTVVFSEQCSYLDTEKKDNLWETCWIKWATQQKRHKWLGVTFLPLFFQALHSPLLVLSLNSVSQSSGPTSTLLCLWHSCDFTIHCIPYYSQCLANLGPRPHYWGKVHCSERKKTATSLK